MRLLIQEYLGMLKEDNELDAVVRDLVSSMGFDVISVPQKGTRQDGVDIHAVGIDPVDKIKKNFLITIKKGKIDRNIWDAPKQGVLASLHDIIYVYVKTKIGPSEKNLPIKIILCCGGELKQEVQSNWTGFQGKHTEFEFDLWNGSKLSGLIEEYLLDEKIFLEDVQKKMRRTLVVLPDPDYDLSHYKLLIENLLFNDNWKELSPERLEGQALKALSTLPVCLGMLFEYSNENDNLKHPLIASEHTLIRAWDFIIKKKLETNQKILGKFNQILFLYLRFGVAYFQKIAPNCFLQDGITLRCQETIGASQVVFEQIGLISSIGLSQLFFGIRFGKDQGIENSKNIVIALKELIKNNTVSGSPSFDGMTLEITLAINLLAIHEEKEFLRKWFDDLINRFSFSYTFLGRGFPICYDSIDLLIEFDKENEHSKEEMASMSTLLPTIAYWCAVLDFKDQYENLIKFVEKDLNHSTLQIWFPDKGIKENLYSKYAGEFGVAEAPILLPRNLDELKARLIQFIEFTRSSDKFEIIWDDCLPGLPLIASRHFRTPVIPFLWLKFGSEEKDQPIVNP